MILFQCEFPFTCDADKVCEEVGNEDTIITNVDQKLSLPELLQVVHNAAQHFYCKFNYSYGIALAQERLSQDAGRR